jgi:hypothetical protein
LGGRSGRRGTEGERHIFTLGLFEPPPQDCRWSLAH